MAMVNLQVIPSCCSCAVLVMNNIFIVLKEGFIGVHMFKAIGKVGWRTRKAVFNKNYVTLLQ